MTRGPWVIQVDKVLSVITKALKEGGSRVRIRDLVKMEAGVMEERRCWL